jgi:hypothetical protein
VGTPEVSGDLATKRCFLFIAEEVNALPWLALLRDGQK